MTNADERNDSGSKATGRRVPGRHDRPYSPALRRRRTSAIPRRALEVSAISTWRATSSADRGTGMPRMGDIRNDVQTERQREGMETRFGRLPERSIRRPRPSESAPTRPPSPPGKRRTSPRVRLDIATARRVDELHRKPTLSETTFISQFDLATDRRVANKKCFPAAKMMVDEGNRSTGAIRVRLTDQYKRIQIAQGKADSNGRISPDPVRAEKAIRYIDKVLDLKLRALVGVSVGDRTETEIPEDLVTGHYVVIYGRHYDANGRIYYDFKDPGTNGEGLAERFVNGKFYVDDRTGILFRQGEDPTSKLSPLLRDYEVSHVRVYDELEL